MSFQVSDAMRSLVPNAKLHIINEDYDTMQWDASNTDTKPTKAEVEAEITRLNTVYESKRYQRQRINDIVQILVRERLVFKQVIQKLLNN